MKIFRFLNKEWNYIASYAIGFFFITNIAWFLFYFYSDDWLIGDNIKTMYFSWKVIFNPIICIPIGILLGYRSWKKKNKIG